MEEVHSFETLPFMNKTGLYGVTAQNIKICFQKEISLKTEPYVGV